MIILPIALIFIAIAAAAAAAFGTHPGWAQFEQGMEVIYLARRLQWILVGVSVVSCLGLIAVSVTDRRRAAWLAGLVPVLILLGVRFAPGRTEDLAVVEDPTFVDVSQVDFVKDDDWVVALKLGDKSFAYPYAALFVEPAVIQSEHDKRLALFWNAQANRVVALQATPDFRGRDLDVVSTPAGSLLLYNAKFGQFICGVTGQTPDRTKPTGLGSAIATAKMPFGRWKQSTPGGRVMKPGPRAEALVLMAPRQPTLPPQTPLSPSRPVSLSSAQTSQDASATVPAGVTVSAGTPAAGTTSASPATVPAGHRRVTLVGVVHPTAVEPGSLGLGPSFIKADDQLAVLLRNDMHGTSLRAFSRKLDDMVLRFEPKRDAKVADLRMGDRETGSLWSANGVAIGGTPQFRGRRLATLPVDEDVDLEVMKRWVPELEVFVETAPVMPPEPAVALKKPEKKTIRKPAAPKGSKPKKTTADPGL